MPGIWIDKVGDPWQYLAYNENGRVQWGYVNYDNQVVAETTTENRGGFQFLNVPPGDYYFLPKQVQGCPFGKKNIYMMKAGETVPVVSFCLS